ncbi:hypothetical protein [Arthrobacter rhombi]|uniref:hypothetical protein n=1 Tax=Arthrobacter rhombi TaxID=71253 RepID=UPI003FCFD618
MSRRQDTSNRHPAVSFVCTGRSSHKLRLLMVVEYANGVASVVQSPAVAQMLIHRDGNELREWRRMFCGVCGLEHQINRDSIEAEVLRVMAAGLRKVDVSTLG